MGLPQGKGSQEDPGQSVSLNFGSTSPLVPKQNQMGSDLGLYKGMGCALKVCKLPQNGFLPGSDLVLSSHVQKDKGKTSPQHYPGFIRAYKERGFSGKVAVYRTTEI